MKIAIFMATFFTEFGKSWYSVHGISWFMALKLGKNQEFKEGILGKLFQSWYRLNKSQYKLDKSLDKLDKSQYRLDESHYKLDKITIKLIKFTDFYRVAP